MTKTLWAVLALLLAVGSSPAYFKYRRAVQAPNVPGQHYFVADELSGSTRGRILSDLRLYVAEKEDSL